MNKKHINNFKKKSSSVTDKIARFAGDIRFIYIHAIFFIGWIIINLTIKPAFDPYPFIFLTLVVSLEAIFLSTFVLINQNKDFRSSERRSMLDFDVDKRSKEEIDKIQENLKEIKSFLYNNFKGKK